MKFEREYYIEKLISGKHNHLIKVVTGLRCVGKSYLLFNEASEVVVYAKLPRTFQIPTPVGNYAPDWAIAMKRNDVKHIFFVAETKGSMSSMDLSTITAVPKKY